VIVYFGQKLRGMEDNLMEVGESDDLIELENEECGG